MSGRSQSPGGGVGASLCREVMNRAPYRDFPYLRRIPRSAVNRRIHAVVSMHDSRWQRRTQCTTTQSLAKSTNNRLDGGKRDAGRVRDLRNGVLGRAANVADQVVAFRPSSVK